MCGEHGPNAHRRGECDIRGSTNKGGGGRDGNSSEFYFFTLVVLKSEILTPGVKKKSERVKNHKLSWIILQRFTKQGLYTIEIH